MSDTIVHVFTTLKVADLIDGLCAAVDAARLAAEGNTRWLAAIDTAYGFLLQQEVISFDLVALAIKVESATQPGKAYIANGECQCSAFTKGAGVCWHRAAGRICVRALAWLEAREVEALAACLEDEALADGCDWYTADIATLGASARLPELLDFARAWDQAALAAQRTASPADYLAMIADLDYADRLRADAEDAA